MFIRLLVALQVIEQQEPVMPGLVPDIHDFSRQKSKTWMAGPFARRSDGSQCPQ